jgi:hypothetical protein
LCVSALLTLHAAVLQTEPGPSTVLQLTIYKN